MGVDVVQVEPRIAGVDLQGCAGVGGGFENSGEIQGSPSRPIISRPVGWPMTLT